MPTHRARPDAPLDRINELLAQLAINGLKSQSLRAARTLFRVLGVSSNSGPSGGALMLYLLFEASYTQELIRLGRADSMCRIEEVKAFFKETQE